MSCWRHPAMTYGPHDPETAPTTVKYLIGRRPEVEEVEGPIPASLVAQRRTMNQRAAGSVRPGHEGPCRACNG